MATIAAALIGGGATYLAAKQAGKRSPQQREAERLLGENTKLASGYGTEMLDRSREALNPVYDYYRKLAGGDRNTLLQFLAPEISAQTDASRRAFQTQTELSPRSGIAVEQTQRMPMDNAAAIARLISGARPAGVQGLASLGTNWASLGMGGLRQGSAGASDILGYEAGRKRDARDAGLGAGESAYAIFKLIQDAAANRNRNPGISDNMNFWLNWAGKT